MEHSAILLTCIKRLSVLKTNFGLLFEWPLKTGFTVVCSDSVFQFSEIDMTGTESTRVRGLGTDVALVSSMVFLAQFLLSLFMGTMVHFTGSTVTIVIVAAILSFCGAICATQVTYLNL